jgi:hypothetical protein
MSELKAALHQCLTSSITAEELSEITDWKILNGLWGNMSNFMTMRLIEARAVEVLSGITDWIALSEMWDDTHDIGIMLLVEERALRVLPDILPKIADWYALVEFWEDAPPCLPIERLIEERMAEMINDITADNIPQWFTDHLRRPDIIINCAAKHFHTKTLELLEQL